MVFTNQQYDDFGGAAWLGVSRSKALFNCNEGFETWETSWEDLKKGQELVVMVSPHSVGSFAYCWGWMFMVDIANWLYKQLVGMACEHDSNPQTGEAGVAKQKERPASLLIVWLGRLSCTSIHMEVS